MSEVECGKVSREELYQAIFTALREQNALLKAHNTELQKRVIEMKDEMQAEREGMNQVLQHMQKTNAALGVTTVPPYPAAEKTHLDEVYERAQAVKMQDVRRDTWLSDALMRAANLSEPEASPTVGKGKPVGGPSCM